MTDLSCDGNHKTGDRIKISCCEHFDIWHNWIYKNILPVEYQSSDYNDGIITFSILSQADEYYKLNKAAEYLYERRIILS